MKKTGILLAGLALAIGAHAQSMSWGLLGGVNMNNQIDHYAGQSTANQMKMGFNGGFVSDWGLNDNWSIQSGLIYTLKGGEQKHTLMYNATDGMHQSELKEKNSLHYLEMPVNLVYKINAGNGNFFVGAGGYASVLMSAYTNYKYKDVADGAELPAASAEGTKHLKVGDKSGDDIHRFDFGLTGIGGYQMANGWFIRGGVDLGLLNIIRTDDISSFQSTLPGSVNNGNPSSKNITYTVVIGYMF